MATQRLVVLKVIGESGRVVAERCRAWAVRQQAVPDDPVVEHEVGRFAEMMDARRTELPVVHYCEWIDRWSMFDTFHEPFESRSGFVLSANGRFCQVCFIDRPAELLTLPVTGWQFDEQTWLAVRLREVAAAWEELIAGGTVLLLQQVIGPFSTDEEIMTTAKSVPEWLSS